MVDFCYCARSELPMTPDPLPRPSFTLWVTLCSLVLGLGTLAYPRTTTDTPIFTYVGWVVLQGGQPYVDAWDIKAPATHLLYAASLFLFGKSALGIRLLDLLWQTATALVLARLAQRIYGRNLAGLLAGLLYGVLYFSHNFWNLAQADGFLSLPLAFAFLFLVRARDEDRGMQWLLAGLGVGLAVLFKLPLGLCGVAMICAALARCPFSWERVGIRLGALAAGFTLPLAGALVYLAAGGGLQGFLNAQFVFAPQYTAFLRATLPTFCVLRAVMVRDLVPHYFLAVIAVAAPLSSLVRRVKVPAPAVAVLVWLAVAVITVTLHGHYLRYHFLPVLAPLAVLGAGWMNGELENWRTKRSFLSALLLAVAFLGLAYTARRVPQHYLFELDAVRHGRAEDAYEDLGHKLRALTSPRDRIYVWGNAPGIYFHAERRAASRFFYALYLYTPERNSAYRGLFLSELRASQPKYILVMKDPGTYHECVPHATPFRAFMEFPELRGLIDADYVIEEETPGSEGILLYRRKSRVTSGAPAHGLSS
jgi:hypothetical protein